MDVHIVEWLWVLVVVMDFVESSVKRSPMQAYMPVVLEQSLVNMSANESKSVIHPTVSFVVPVHSRMASHYQLFEFFLKKVRNGVKTT